MIDSLPEFIDCAFLSHAPHASAPAGSLVATASLLSIAPPRIARARSVNFANLKEADRPIRRIGIYRSAVPELAADQLEMIHGTEVTHSSTGSSRNCPTRFFTPPQTAARCSVPVKCVA